MINHQVKVSTDQKGASFHGSDFAEGFMHFHKMCILIEFNGRTPKYMCKMHRKILHKKTAPNRSEPAFHILLQIWDNCHLFPYTYCIVKCFFFFVDGLISQSKVGLHTISHFYKDVSLILYCFICFIGVNCERRWNLLYFIFFPDLTNPIFELQNDSLPKTCESRLCV